MTFLFAKGTQTTIEKQESFSIMFIVCNVSTMEKGNLSFNFNYPILVLLQIGTQN